MESLIKGLFDDRDDDERARGNAQDFVSRFEDGAPTEGFSDEEAVRNFHNVANRLSPRELEDSAADRVEGRAAD